MDSLLERENLSQNLELQRENVVIAKKPLVVFTVGLILANEGYFLSLTSVYCAQKFQRPQKNIVRVPKASVSLKVEPSSGTSSIDGSIVRKIATEVSTQADGCESHNSLPVISHILDADKPEHWKNSSDPLDRL